jgi:hypothetical protein
MIVIENSIIPFRGFLCVNLFGVIFTRDKKRITWQVLNHELIHTMQLLEVNFYFSIPWLLLSVGISWWCLVGIPFSYYIWYLTEWFFRFLIALATFNEAEQGKRREYMKKAYYELLFEQEARNNQDKILYIRNRQNFAWLNEKLQGFLEKYLRI